MAEIVYQITKRGNEAGDVSEAEARQINLELMSRLQEVGGDRVQTCGRGFSKVLVFNEPIDVKSMYDDGDPRKDNVSGNVYFCLTAMGILGLRIPGTSNSGREMPVEVRKGERMMEMVRSRKSINGGGFTEVDGEHWYLNLDMGGNISCDNRTAVMVPEAFAVGFINSMVTDRMMVGEKKAIGEGKVRVKDTEQVTGYRKMFEDSKRRYGVEKEWEEMTIEERYTIIWLGTFEKEVVSSISEVHESKNCRMRQKLYETYIYNDGALFREALKQAINSCIKEGRCSPGDVTARLLDYPEALTAYDREVLSMTVSGGEGESSSYLTNSARGISLKPDTVGVNKEDKEEMHKLADAVFESVYLTGSMGYWDFDREWIGKKGNLNFPKIFMRIKERLLSENGVRMSGMDMALFYNYRQEKEGAVNSARCAVNEYINTVLTGTKLIEEIGGRPDFVN